MERERGVIRRHGDLEVYRRGFTVAMRIFELTKGFPLEERFSLTDQIRRSSRSVCSNIAEAFQKRRYQAAFISKLSDSEAEAAETQTWLRFALSCGYLSREIADELSAEYDVVIGMLVRMITRPGSWTL
jgi:four helix bundle protein